MSTEYLPAAKKLSFWKCKCPEYNNHSLGYPKCNRCGKECDIKASGEGLSVSHHGGILPNRKAAISSPDVQNPEADEGKSLAASVLPPSSADLRDLLHDFAMTYRVESRKSRNECIDNVIMKIGNLMSIPSIKMKERLIAILYFALPALALIGFSVWLIKVSLLLP